jgi:hypothetical protein
MAGDAIHQRYPLVETPMQWGFYPSEQGAVSGTLPGLFTNTIWLPPPTAPQQPPLEKSKGAWNKLPGDQFIPRGICPRGPFSYTSNGSPRDSDHKNPIGSGIFYVAVPANRKLVHTKVQNPTTQPASLKVEVNGRGNESTVSPGQTITIQTPIENNATDLSIRYTGQRDLVILETKFW